MNRLPQIVVQAFFGMAIFGSALAQTGSLTPSVAHPAGFQQMNPISSALTPVLDGLSAPAESQLGLGPESAPLPQMPISAANPNFGGFRVAPSTPAHSPGDTSRDLSSVSADINHDGCQDIVTFQSQTLTYMQGDCHGNFTRVNSQSTVGQMFHPVAVDINHDGYPDIIGMTLPYAYSGTVVALINRKDGTFASPVTISKKASVYSGLESMSIYDINGDGNPDVIITGFGTVDAMSNSNIVMEVITGNADGTFNTATEIESVGYFPGKPTFGYDGGTAMRVVNGQLYLYGFVQQALRIDDQAFGSSLLCRWAVSSNGKVDLANVQITTLPFFNSSPSKYLNFADLNGDGITDLTIMPGDGELYTALGASDGSFGSFVPALPFTAGNLAAVVSFHDVDGDGIPDAIMAGASFVGVWLGNGDGTFRTPKATYIGGYAFNAASGLTFPVTNHVIGDFNGDGIPDVVFFDTPKRSLSFYKGLRDGTLVGAPALVSTSGDFQSNSLIVLATPDLNGDGIKDVVVNSPYGVLSGIADGKGNFTYRTLSSLQGISAISAYTADFNKDGKDDVVFIGTDNNSDTHLYIGLSNGDGTITALPQTLPYSSTAFPQILIGDINGDGFPDLTLLLNSYSPAPAKYGAYPMTNDGTGHLTSGAFINTGSTVFGGALQDLNGDGKADLIMSYGGYSAAMTSIYLVGSGGVFPASPTSILQTTLPGGAVLAKDVTGDGIADIVLTVPSGVNAGLTMYVGKGDGTFGSATPLVTGVGVYYADAADLNGDGYPDIYFSNSQNILTDANDAYFGLVVLPGAGRNTFGAARQYNIAGPAAPVLPVDLYGNGTLSLLASASSSGTTLLINTGGTSLTLSSSKTTWSSSDTSTVTVQVSPFFKDQPVPTGYVDLYVDGAAQGRSSIATNGSVMFTLASLAAGTHTVSAQYEGDSNYNVNLRSNQVTVTVVKATPSFTLSSSSSALSISQSGSATASLALQANAAFSGPVTLACSGAPGGTVCSFGQNSVFLAPGQTVASTVTISAATHATNHLPVTIGGGILTCLLLFPVLRRKRARFVSLAGLICLLTVFQLSGCSSNTAHLGISPGAYAVTVTATPGDPTASPQTLNVIVTVTK